MSLQWDKNSFKYAFIILLKKKCRVRSNERMTLKFKIKPHGTLFITIKFWHL